MGLGGTGRERLLSGGAPAPPRSPRLDHLRQLPPLPRSPPSPPTGAQGIIGWHDSACRQHAD